MSSFSRHSLAVSLALLIIATPALAQRGRRGGGGDAARRPAAPPVWRGKADLSGKVTDETGKGVGNAKVTLILIALNSGFFVMTKKNGDFSAKDLKSGDWHMQVEAANFAVWRKELQVTDDRNAPIEVKLVRDNSNELIAKAEELFRAGNMPEARAEFMKVRELHPELMEVNRAIAFTYGRERNHAEALKYLDMALADSPTDTLMLQLAAGSALEVNDVARAMEYVSKVDDKTLTDADPLLNIAVALLRKRQYADAVKVLDRAIARFPQSPDAYFYRGLGRYDAKDPTGAKSDLEQYISMAPADAPQLPQAKELVSKIK